MAATKLATLWQRAAKRQARALTQAQERTTRELARAAAAARQPPPGRGEWLQGAVLGPAGTRRWYLFRPAVPVRRRLPLLVMLHGCGQDAREFALSTGMNRLAAREGFMVLYPEQDRLAHPQGCWNWYDTRSGQALAEVATLATAVEQVALLHAVDRERIAVAGLSAGASMAALLGVRRPQLFRAVAMHSGVPPGLARSSATALRAMLGHGAIATVPLGLPLQPGVPLPPLLVLHGSADRVVSTRNAAAAAELWAQAAGARCGAWRTVQRGQRHAMQVTDYKCGRRTVATLCEVQGLGHAWSGGDARQRFGDPHGPDASRLVWRFVRAQFDAR
ncbi:extracellular catalytic domain type 1 short-chain-length polyhydroxyalkanoate depolymerase [Azohydromonas caseinilytica]|uniref:PHB depolymerase family esterase n=1 Tax=Azohydromonas caseinilytica TaxID=2728836 RepID=A0A848FFE1_9BURK|nr:PHB depolymerase family esterase [Azohydromonas caseinilytica]NML17836.1 PHB depolymerase family esterase [Azohydromonas caseinilytica]